MARVAVIMTLWLLVLAVLTGCRQKGRNSLPDFPLLLTDSSTVIQTGRIPEGEPIVLMFFDPDCGHCQAETRSLLANMDSLKNVRLYFATVESFKRMEVFQNYYKLQKYPNVTVGRDFGFYIPFQMKIPAPPATLVYNSKKQLVAVFKGEAKAKDIIKMIRLDN